MGRRQRHGVDLIELIEPDDQGWDAVAPAAPVAHSTAAGSAHSKHASGPTAGSGRRKGFLVAAGLATSFGLGVAVPRITSNDATDVASPPSTTAAPPTTEGPSVIYVTPERVTAQAPDPLLVDVPAMIATSAQVTDRPADDSSSPPVVVFRNPSTGETLRLLDVPRSTPRAASRVDLGEGLVGHESRIGDVTTVIVEGSNPVRAVIGTASRDTLHRVLVVAERGGNVEDTLNSLGFVIRHASDTGGLWTSADETTVTYVPINDPRATPWNDRPSIMLSQLRQPLIPTAWAMVLPQHFDVRGATAFGGYLGSQAVLGVPLADQVVVLRGNGFSLDQLVAAAATLRPAGAGEWNEILSGAREREVSPATGVPTRIDSGVLLGGTPWATEVVNHSAGVDSWIVQAGSSIAFSYLGINRVERPLLLSTVVDGATAVLAVAPRDGVYRLRVVFGDGVQLDLPLRSVTNDSITDSDWQARSYMWSELGPWTADVIDGNGVVVATLDPTQGPL